MSLKPLLSFSGGELDPVLHDRVTLEKFNSGLATGRNVIVGKTGSLLSRFARAHFKKSKNNGEAIRIYSPPNSRKIIEFGVAYIRIYDFDGTLDADITASTDADPIFYTEEVLSKLHFSTSGKYVYITSTLNGYFVGRLVFKDTTPEYEYASNDTFLVTPAPTSMTVTPSGTPAGYFVDYLVTVVNNGEESLSLASAVSTYQKPVASPQYNLIDVLVAASVPVNAIYNEIRVYSRPSGGGAFGLLGVSTDFYVSAGQRARYIDLGGEPDYTIGPPDIITKNGLGAISMAGAVVNTSVIYQQRLLLANFSSDNEAILASRPGYKNNFYRDFPYSADSALKFKSGTSGTAEVLRMIDADGLIVFTTVGVFVSIGTLSISNIALEKKGSWVIDVDVPPLSVPGGVFFVEKDTGVIRQLIFNDTIVAYEAQETTIFSNHIFKNKTVISWAYQHGVAPMIIVTFSDGTFAMFTYQFEQQMKAWTRGDSKYPVEQVEGTGIADSTFFVTNKDGDRYIEVSLPRYAPPATIVANPEYDKTSLAAFMDAVVTKSNLLNDSLAGADEFVLVPVTPDDWEGELTLTCGTSALFPNPGLGEVGTIFRFFDINDKSAVDLEVTARASSNSVTVLPSAEFPSDQATGFRMYETFDTVTGLTHLEDENVGILLDGYVANSPNNDVEVYTPVIVASGEITIPDGARGAIIIVGRPITADIKTLNLSTVEQSPTLLESLTVNKLYVRVHETRGVYISNKFPEELTEDGPDGNSVDGMEDLDDFYVPEDEEIIGNRYKQPVSKRIERTIPGSWNSQGQAALRQVDPVHFEIMSIVLDAEVLNRSNRGDN